jgi:hypothetical protein
MQGVGTYESPDGSSYQGSWLRDQKHGLGRKQYPNGDCYEGLWCFNKPHGPGRCVNHRLVLQYSQQQERQEVVGSTEGALGTTSRCQSTSTGQHVWVAH